MLVIAVPQCKVATIDVSGGPGGGRGHDGTAGALATLGRKVAGGLQVNRHDAIRADIGLTYLRAGYAIRAMSYDAATAAPATSSPRPRSPQAATRTSRWAGHRRQGQQPAVPPARSRQAIPQPVRGRPVQGHPTWISTARAYPILFIEGALHGRSIVLSGSVPTDANLTELYKIADGLTLH